jgi:hypothetical protein
MGDLGEITAAEADAVTAVAIAAGAKSAKMTRRINCSFLSCHSFPRPGDSNCK